MRSGEYVLKVLWSGTAVPRFPLVGTVYRSTAVTSSASSQAATAAAAAAAQQQQQQQQQVGWI